MTANITSSLEHGGVIENFVQLTGVSYDHEELIYTAPSGRRAILYSIAARMTSGTTTARIIFMKDDTTNWKVLSATETPSFNQYCYVDRPILLDAGDALYIRFEGTGTGNCEYSYYGYLLPS